MFGARRNRFLHGTRNVRASRARCRVARCRRIRVKVERFVGRTSKRILDDVPTVREKERERENGYIDVLRVLHPLPCESLFERVGPRGFVEHRIVDTAGLRNRFSQGFARELCPRGVIRYTRDSSIENRDSLGFHSRLPMN